MIAARYLSMAMAPGKVKRMSIMVDDLCYRLVPWFHRRGITLWPIHVKENACPYYHNRKIAAGKQVYEGSPACVMCDAAIFGHGSAHSCGDAAVVSGYTAAGRLDA